MAKNLHAVPHLRWFEISCWLKLLFLVSWLKMSFLSYLSNSNHDPLYELKQNFSLYQTIWAVVVTIFNRKKGEAVIKDMIQEMFICIANVLD